MKNIVCISGTSRPGNFTLKALKVVMNELNEVNLNPILFDACELALDFPGRKETEDAKRMQSAIKDSVGVVLATPEYHGTFAAMTKLIIENMGFPSALSKKPIALVGVAQGRIGAIKSLEQLKGVCSHVGALTVPGSVSIAGVQQAFNEKDECIDTNTEKSLRKVAHSLEEFVKEYVCPKYALEEMVRQNTDAWSTNI